MSAKWLYMLFLRFLTWRGRCNQLSARGVMELTDAAIIDKPPLAGLSAQYFAKQMRDYGFGARKHSLMNMTTKPLSDQVIVDSATYYASLKSK